MGWYDLTCEWVRTHNLILNRCKCLGYVVGDAVVVEGRAGRYAMRLWGREVCRWSAYDLESVRTAFAVADSMFDGMWDARRLGILSAVDV